jgi:hypothetical protein
MSSGPERIKGSLNSSGGTDNTRIFRIMDRSRLILIAPRMKLEKVKKTKKKKIA